MDLISTLDGLRALRDEWTELLASSAQPSPFLTWEWQFAWWQHYGEPYPRRQLAVVTAHDGQSLTALLPGYVRASGPGRSTVRSFHLLGSSHESSDGLDVLQCEPARDDSLATLVEYARQTVSPDRICLGDLAEDSAIVARVPALAAKADLPLALYRTHTCPYLPITGTWSDYLASRGSAFRQTVGRRTRRFFERPGASFDSVTRAEEVPAALQDVFTLHERRFAQKRARTRFVARHRGAFHQSVSRLMFDRGALRLFRLRLEGRTVATLYCFEHAARLFYYQGGIDPDWERESVGTVLMAQVIKYAFDRELQTFEFLRGAEPYKFNGPTMSAVSCARILRSRAGVVSSSD